MSLWNDPKSTARRLRLASQLTTDHRGGTGCRVRITRSATRYNSATTRFEPLPTGRRDLSPPLDVQALASTGITRAPGRGGGLASSNSKAVATRALQHPQLRKLGPPARVAQEPYFAWTSKPDPFSRIGFGLSVFSTPRPTARTESLCFARRLAVPSLLQGAGGREGGLLVNS